MSSENTPLLSKEELNKIFQEEKSKADTLTRESKYSEAIGAYEELIKKINKELKLNKDLTKEEKDSIIREFLLTAHSNLCLISIKQKDWNSALKNANFILKFEKNNIKAMYRKCYSEINMREYENAQETLNELKKLMPENTELKNLENMFDEKKTEDNLKEMKKYRNMMKRLHKVNEEEEYNNMSKIGRFFYDCKGVCRRIFCCCNKRRTVKKIN